jgi:hypothetical protein
MSCFFFFSFFSFSLFWCSYSFHFLWTSGAGVSRMEAAKQLEEVMVVRENADLCWIWGALDCSGRAPWTFRCSISRNVHGCDDEASGPMEGG